MPGPTVRMSFSHFGLYVTDRGPIDVPGGVVNQVFLSCDPREHHQFVLASGRPDDVNFNLINQISFRVDGLATLREMHEGLKSEAVKEITTLTHGNALSCYFRDPENNRIELLIDTPWYVPQPHHLNVDFALSDGELWGVIEKHVRGTPGFKPVAEWMTDIERRIAQATANRRSRRERVSG